MKRRVLITGANGFVASRLIKKLKEDSALEVFATTRNVSSVSKLLDTSKVFKMDLNDQGNIEGVLKEVSPSVVVHLAAQSNVGLSWRDPYGTFKVNTLGSICLLNAIEETNRMTKVLLVGSSDEYGMTAKEKELLSETDICKPQNPYSISKNALSQYVEQLNKKDDINILYFRPFNHFGPGQSNGFVVSDFCFQIAEIEAGIREPVIKVGDLSTYRDLLPVSDVVEAYYLAILTEIERGIYNIASGKSVFIENVLETLLSLATTDIIVERDPTKYRRSEVVKFAGNADKFKNATGWKPKRGIINELEETLNWWREKVNRGTI